MLLVSDGGYMEVRQWLYLVAGHVCVALGLIGIFVPLLPTVPFVLLAAYCYERGSPRFHKILLENRYLGPPLRRWKEKKAIPPHAKIMAVLMLGGSGAWLFYLAPFLWVKTILVVLVGLLCVYIVSRPQ